MKTLPLTATIGILGGGQLGRMTALAAARLGIKSHMFCAEDAEPALDVAAQQTIAAFDDEEALERFARAVDIVTLEWENVPLRALEIVARHVPMRPGAEVLRVAQDRRLEKEFARAVGVGTPDFEIVRSVEALSGVMARFSLPAVLKATRMGYDGKGQVLVTSGMSANEAWRRMGGEEGILESFVDFACEVSVIVARREDGVMAAFPVVQNVHENHILKETTFPAILDPSIEKEASEIARVLAEKLGVIGLLAVEMFVLKAPDAQGRRVVMNEIAPRPHNSGHWTIEGCACSQFEQLIRAIAGWPLGDPRPRFAGKMVNLLGQDVGKVPALLGNPCAHVHLYGKKETRPGRKMGHVTFLAAALSETKREEGRS